MNNFKLKDTILKLGESDSAFAEIFKHGTMSIEIYKPVKIDHQQPHSQDEIYVILEGKGRFFNDGEWSNFNKGDLIFVKAGAEHFFQDFSDDFMTWVIFYGPKGGET